MGRRILLFWAVLIVSLQAEASSVQYIRPDYYLGKLVDGVLFVASQVGQYQFDVVHDPSAERKAQAALQAIYARPAFHYVYDDISVIVIRGNDGEPNGFSFGGNIYVTKSLVDLLTFEELTAVIAHELAHSEKAHNLQKTPLPLEATVYQLKNIGVALKEGRWPRGKDLLRSIQDLMEMGGVAMELQADCLAAQQLDHMRRSGLKNSPLDLIGASNKIFGFDVSKDESNEPWAVRAHAIVNKMYAQGSCDLF
jgi:hypothetical protein